MRKQLGWLAYFLLVAFTAGLLLTMIGFAWSRLPGDKAGIGVLGFGLPMLLAGLATHGLSGDERRLRMFLGWTGTVAGMICGVCLLVCVASMVLSAASFTGASPEILASVGFGVLMLLCGGLGIAWLIANHPAASAKPDADESKE
jgi:hypothetical protein